MSAPPNHGYQIRSARASDLPWVLHHRRQMFLDMGFAPAAVEASMAVAEPFFGSALASGDYRAWLVEEASGQVIAGGGLILIPFQPGPTDPSDKRPWVVNMYTEPGHRRQGLARRLMEAMIQWCRQQGQYAVYLHASAKGRPLYESLGFHQTNEMRLDLRREP